MIPMLVSRLCVVDRKKVWVLGKSRETGDVVDDLVEGVDEMDWGARRVVEFGDECVDLVWMRGDSALDVCCQMVGRMVREAIVVCH